MLRFDIILFLQRLFCASGASGRHVSSSADQKRPVELVAATIPTCRLMFILQDAIFRQTLLKKGSAPKTSHVQVRSLDSGPKLGNAGPPKSSFGAP